VLLWEMMTHEVPYKDVDTSAIIWGVGSNSLSLPIPASCPEGFKLLMKLCWSLTNVLYAFIKLQSLLVGLLRFWPPMLPQSNKCSPLHISTTC